MGCTPPEGNHHLAYDQLTKAVVKNSSKKCFRPEMMMALQADVSGRLLVDAWSREERESLLFDPRTFLKGARHENWTKMLQECMEILRPEYERWYGNAAESLAGVSDEIFLISMSD